MSADTGSGVDARQILSHRVAPAETKTFEIPLRWVRSSSSAWLVQQFGGDTVKLGLHPRAMEIERFAARTDRLGPQQLWKGYAAGRLGATRTPSQVRIPRVVGNWFAELVQRRRPNTVVESFGLQVGTFEENIDRCLAGARSIDIALIDAIHRSEFVLPQLEMLVARCTPGALIILDDINFSRDMADCWQRVSSDPRFVTSAILGERLGIVELSKREL